MQNSCRVFSFMLSFKTHVGTLGWFENCNKLMIGPLFQWLLQLGNNWWVQTICIWFSSSRNCSKIDEIQVCCVLLWTCSQQRTRCLWYLIYKSSIKILLRNWERDSMAPWSILLPHWWFLYGQHLDASGSCSKRFQS